jgi:membrane protein
MAEKNVEAGDGGPDRGREAGSPGQIPRPGWRDILIRTWQEQTEHNLSIIAGGVAFYALMAIFPTLAAMVSIYGLVANPADVQAHLSSLSGMLPESGYQIIDDQLTQIVSASGGALGLGLIAAILFALWSASRGMLAVIMALNVVYEEPEKRSFLKLNAIALLLTLLGIIFFLISLSLIAALPGLLSHFGLPDSFRILITIGRWPLLAVLIALALAFLYRYAPSREEPQFRWISWGAVLATIVWIIVSALFSIYVSNFGSYNETYGSISAIIILMMWLYITAYVVLMGGELNAEMEHQTKKDTTTGEPEPMGGRGAHVADKLGKKP